MNWEETYKKWINFSNLDVDIKKELELMSQNERMLEDLFYKNLEFGTGGMRGEIGPGTNRINVYTVRKASEGLARYIESFGDEAKVRGVAIAYDSRHKSSEFALEAARTLGQHGIKTYVFEELRPTPELSFAVRYLNAFAGIVITASHNPPEYNGFKVYAEDGGQLPPRIADAIIDKVNEVENELTIQVAEVEELKQKGLLKILGEEIDQVYTHQLKSISINPEMIEHVANDLKIIFTPIHGTANKPVRRGLEALGFKNVIVVEEQELPDPNFSTVKSPNPEEHEAFELAIKYGQKIDADILIGTDPDADRIGVAVKNENNEYVVLTGNQMGALMLHYILSQKKKKGVLPANGVVLKTIVTSEIGRTIAAKFGIATYDTLTGFKFIGEKIKEFETSGEYVFQFGYEESYGYLIGDFVRDKDAVQSALMAAEVAAFYKQQGMTLYQGLLEIFEEYGYYREDLVSLTLKGKDGAEKINEMMASFRNDSPKIIGDNRVVTIEDYKASVRFDCITGSKATILLPKSNVLKYQLDNGSWFCLRPSGTEPKIKFYFGVKGTSLSESKELLKELIDSVTKLIN